MNPISKQSGTVAVDPKQIPANDLQEAACMLYSTMTLLRQSFGIVNMVNSILDKPFSTDELKSFGKSFDIVHSSIGVSYKGLVDYISKLPRNEGTAS